MNLRRTVRRTIQQGNSVFATVEDVHNGLVTVRLVAGGARLTSLSFLGLEVTVGQRVIVDYSSGSPPVVRPIIGSENITRLPVRAETIAENSDVNLDTSCYLDNFFPYMIPLSDGVSQIVTWFRPYWDTNNFHTNSGYGDQTIYIQKAGKYLIHCQWDDNPANGAENYGKGYFEIEFRCNDIPFSLLRYASWANDTEFTATNLFTLHMFRAGDILTVRFLAKLGLPDLETTYLEYWPSLYIHWLPGTGAIFITRSNVKGYTEGT